MDILDFLKQNVAADYLEDFLDVLSQTVKIKTLLEHVEFVSLDGETSDKMEALRVIAVEALTVMLPFEQKLCDLMNADEALKPKRVLDPNDLSNN